MEEKLRLCAEMKSTWLIQRLQKPQVFKIAGKEMDNPFSFGGGLKNGGLSEDAMKLLRKIFSFDYMGSAEFEFGAVPAALQFIAEQASKKNIVIGETRNKKETVFYLCPKPYKEEVEKRIEKLRKGKFQLKEHCGLSWYFDNADKEWAKRNVGWLELDNGFMFFVDKEMFQKTCELFGIQIGAEA